MSESNQIESILTKLDKKGIFSITKLDNDSFVFSEECDRFFKCTLTKNEIRQLIAELHLLIKL